MAKTRKILIWGGTGAGIFAVLLVALVLVLPQILNTDAIEHTIASTLETRYHVRTERVEIAILPYPRLILHGARMTVPEVLTANAEQVAVSPKLLPLLTGKIMPSSVDMLTPRVVARLPEQSASNQSEAAAHHRIARIRDKLAQLQGTILAAMPGVVFDINDGSLEIYSGQDRVFWFQEIDLRSSVHAHGIEFELSTGKSDLWNAFTFNGRLDPSTWKSSGELNLTGGTPLDAIRYFLPAASQRVSDAQVDLKLNISADGPGNIRADFNATVPQLTLDDELDKTVVQNGLIAGFLVADNEGVDVSLTQFRLDYPRLSITGRYVEKYADQSFGIDLEGRDTDATAVRSAILAWDKDSQVVRKIFEIIRAGEVPTITFSAHTNKASELKKLENFTIKGRIEKGTIFPPKAELLVEDARGDVTVSNGILEAMNLYGKTATGTTTFDGSLRIGLRGGDAPFHLDLPLDADLSELPDVLNRVVDSEAFKHELALIKDVKGRARGRLLLGENLKDVKVRVETGQFQLDGRYDRIAEPLELSGASFLLEGSKVSGTGLAGKIGRSKFTDLTASYDWKDGKNLQFNTSVMAVVSLDLLNPVINWPENWQKAMNGSLPKGVLVFDSLDFKGPIPDRSKWAFKAGGTIEEVTFHSNRLTGPVKLSSGTFDLSDDDVRLKEVGATLADSSVTVSGTLKGWFENLRSADLTFGGQLGPKGNRDIAGIVGLPSALRAISNLVVSNSHMVWKKDQSTVFDGEMQVSSGPRVTIGKVERTKAELSIEDLAIKDPDSDAMISIKSGEGQVNVKFSGTLSNRTVDKLLTENKMLTGPIQGKFNAQLFLDSPKKSTAQGQVRISGFQLPLNRAVPARIENATLEANGNRIDVRSAVISWNGSRLSLGGNITITEAAYNVDMNAFADDLNLESLLKSKEESKGDGTDLVEKAEQKPGKAWDTPVRGTIRVRSERLTYGKLTWNPANADLVLSPGLIDVRINQANLCGISTVGKIAITRDGLKLAITPKSRDQDLEPALSCIFNKQHLLSGKFDMTGNLTASVNGGKLVDTLEGDIDFTAKHGRIYRYDTFAKIVSMLSITEIYRGVLPDLFTEGCAYDKIIVKGKIKNGKLTLSESVVDGPCVKMVFRGDVDFAKKKMDVNALVTPLRTVDRIVGAVPVLGKLLDGVFFSVPVRVLGDISDPAVIPMSPTAVGEELFGFMKRTFRLPLTILQPLAEGQGSQDQGNEDRNPTPNSIMRDRVNDH